MFVGGRRQQAIVVAADSGRRFLGATNRLVAPGRRLLNSHAAHSDE
jgi:hypothetical protein